MSRVEFPFFLQSFVIAPKRKDKGPAEGMVVGIFCPYHDLVFLVTAHDNTLVDQLRQIVIDISQVNLDSACPRCRWLTLVTTKNPNISDF